MEIKSFFYGVISTALLVLLMTSFGFAHLGSVSSINNIIEDDSASQSSSSSNPEKCRLPAGQDLNSWKEHLGHHQETKDCLKYFN